MQFHVWLEVKGEYRKMKSGKKKGFTYNQPISLFLVAIHPHRTPRQK